MYAFVVCGAYTYILSSACSVYDAGGSGVTPPCGRIPAFYASISAFMNSALSMVAVAAQQALRYYHVVA